VSFPFGRSLRAKLILNGDIIDGWQQRRGGSWTKAHTRLPARQSRRHPADVLPLDFENLSVVEDHIHEGPRGRYLVLHGDIFDTVTKNFVFLAHLGDWGYRALLSINRIYNAWRAWRGKEYWSLSKAIKAKVKDAVNYVSNFEEHIAELAEKRRCSGVLCGHIHTAADKMIGSGRPRRVGRVSRRSNAERVVSR
jgi:UDP-2,3-diacylglucosamine pyrophosphatase LpxH